MKLLDKDPKKRLGVNDKNKIKEHEFFNDINWEELEKKHIKPPIDLVCIKLENEIPFNYKKNNKSINSPKINNTNNNENNVKNFTFVRPNSSNKNK